MFRVRRPPEWGVEPVPQGLRVLRTFDLFVLWSSLGIGLLVLAAGTLLIGLGLTLAEAAIVALVGSVLGSLMLAAAAHHGSRAGVPTMVSLRPILGRRGSYIPTALNVFQLLGWATFELLVMGIAAATLTGNVFGPSTQLLFIPLFGAVVAALALGGPLAVIRAWLEKFAIWLVYASTAAIGIALIWKGPDLGLRYAPFSGTTSLLLALDRGFDPEPGAEKTSTWLHRRRDPDRDGWGRIPLESGRRHRRLLRGVPLPDRRAVRAASRSRHRGFVRGATRDLRGGGVL